MVQVEGETKAQTARPVKSVTCDIHSLLHKFAPPPPPPYQLSTTKIPRKWPSATPLQGKHPFRPDNCSVLQECLQAWLLRGCNEEKGEKARVAFHICTFWGWGEGSQPTVVGTLIQPLANTFSYATEMEGSAWHSQKALENGFSDMCGSLGGRSKIGCV